MKRIQIVSSNPGTYHSESSIFTRVQSFDHAMMRMTDEEIEIQTSSGQKISSKLEKTEEDFLSITYQGVFEDGTKFRVVRPYGVALEIAQATGDKEKRFSIGSVNPDGYAVHFVISEGEIDKSNFSKEEPPKIEKLAQTAILALQTNPQLAKQHLIRIYRIFDSDPNQLWKCNNLDQVTKCFALMLDFRISDDIDNLQKIASVGYLVASKALEQHPEKKLNIILDRIIIMKIGREPLQYTVMSALNLMEGGIFSVMGSMAPLRSRDAIFKMQIADIELNPTLWMQLKEVKEWKNEFDKMIGDEFFLPEKTRKDVIKSGLDTHKRLFEYLTVKVIDEGDVDF